MADLIKKIKIKKQDGTFTDYIPIGAEAQNVSTTDGDSVQLKLNKKPYYYNSVADMKADTKLKVGDMAVTLGYYELNDGGAAEYKILTSSNNYYETLNNSLRAELIIKNKINVLQLGAKGDLLLDDSIYFQRAIDLAYKIKLPVYIPSNKKFLIENTLEVLYFRPITFIGDYKCNYSGADDYYCNIFCTTDFITRGGDSNTDKRASIVMENLAICFWNNKNNKQPVTSHAVFKGVILNNSIIKNNLFVGAGYFIYDGSLKFVTNILNNRFSNLNKSFICTYDIDNAPASIATTNTISDSYISNNYINGNGSQNPIFIIGTNDGEADTVYENNYIDYFKYLIDCTPTIGNGMASIGKLINNTLSSCFRITPRVISGFFINNNFEGWNRTNINEHFTNQDSFMQNAKIGPFIIDPADLTYNSDLKTDFRLVKIIDNTIANLDYFIFIISNYINSNSLMKGFYEKGTQNPYYNEPVNDMFVYKPWGGNGDTPMTTIFNTHIDSMDYKEITDESLPDLKTTHNYNNQTYNCFTTYKNQHVWYNGNLYIATKIGTNFVWKQLSN